MAKQPTRTQRLLLPTFPLKSSNSLSGPKSAEGFTKMIRAGLFHWCTRIRGPAANRCTARSGPPGETMSLLLKSKASRSRNLENFSTNWEAHCLQEKYRYDHVHRAGDVTIWSNFSTLHNAPAVMRIINRPEDARLIYRISCKGDPRYELPRDDSDEWIEANLNPPYRSNLN